MPIRQGAEKRDDFCAASGGVNAVNLKPVLGKIETYRGNMRSGLLLSVRAGAVRPIKTHAT
jgi:hypothetical protein